MVRGTQMPFRGPEDSSEESGDLEKMKETCDREDTAKIKGADGKTNPVQFNCVTLCPDKYA